MSNLSSSNEENSSSILESKSSKSKSISKEVQNTEKESEYSLKDPNNPSSKSEIKKNQSEDNSKEENGERSWEDNYLVKILKNIDPILKSHQRNKIVEELAKFFINTYREIFKDSDEATFQEDAKKITTQLYNKLLNKGENEIIAEKEENKDFDDEKEEEVNFYFN